MPTLPPTGFESLTWPRLRKLLAVLGAALALATAGCGGGGGGGQTFFDAGLPGDHGQPEITLFFPTEASAFTRVSIYGRNLTGTTAVRFGGVPSPRLVVEDAGTVRAVVPAGAGSGPLELTTARGRCQSSSSFLFDSAAAQPYIFSILPESGPVGSEVKIRGSQLFAVSGVDFGGAPAELPEIVSDSELTVTVPAEAHSGPITVSLPDGGSDASRLFTVDGRPPQAPVLKAFSPTSGPLHTTLKLEGRHFSTVNEVEIGGRKARFFVWDDKRITAWLPLDCPASATLTVRSPSGQGSHPAPFHLEVGKPEIHHWFPAEGCPGMEVEILGDNLQHTQAVAFGPGRTTDLLECTDSVVRVAVPAGARTGPIQLEGPHGHAVTRGTFTVTKEDPGPQAQIAGMYVTQATQRMDGSVPLVAGRDGLLRVFVLGNQVSSVVPAVQVTLLDGQGQTLLSRELHATASVLPRRVDEGDLSRSWNLPIPGTLLQPGVRLQAELLAQAGLALPAEGGRFPRDGKPMALKVVEVAKPGITLVPVVTTLGKGNVSNATRSKESWVEPFRRMFPIAGLDLEVRAPYSFDKELGSDIYNYVVLRNQLEVERLLGNGSNRRYWYGVFPRPVGGRLLGLGDTPPAVTSNLRRTAIGMDAELSGANGYAATFAHEMGHLLDRSHAPCGGAGGPDLKYPYPGGVIGAPGLDVQAGQTFDPKHSTDVMGYCSDVWISDYTYKGALELLTRERTAAAGSAQALQAPEDNLLIWGTLNHGVVHLEPVFSTASGVAMPEPGECVLVCRDGAGHPLFEVPFKAEGGPDIPEGQGLGSFAFIIPNTPAMRDGLASIEVRRAGAVAAILTASAPRAVGGGAALLVREPVARVWGEGRVHLSWDPDRHPRVNVCDASTGESLALAEGGSVVLATGARELRVTFSDGLRSITRRIPVTD